MINIVDYTTLPDKVRTSFLHLIKELPHIYLKITLERCLHVLPYYRFRFLDNIELSARLSINQRGLAGKERQRFIIFRYKELVVEVQGELLDNYNILCDKIRFMPCYTHENQQHLKVIKCYIDNLLEYIGDYNVWNIINGGIRPDGTKLDPTAKKHGRKYINVNAKKGRVASPEKRCGRVVGPTRNKNTRNSEQDDKCDIREKRKTKQQQWTR